MAKRMTRAQPADPSTDSKVRPLFPRGNAWDPLEGREDRREHSYVHKVKPHMWTGPSSQVFFAVF